MKEEISTPETKGTKNTPTTTAGQTASPSSSAEAVKDEVEKPRKEESTEDPEVATETVSKTNLIRENLEMHIRKFLTPDSVHHLTKRKLRDQLAECLAVPIDTINNVKDEISRIVDTVVAEIAKASEVTEAEAAEAQAVCPEDSEALNSQMQRTKRKLEDKATGSIGKRVKTERGKGDESDAEADAASSEADESSSASSSSEDEHPKRRAKAKAKAKGVKALQGKLMTKHAFLDTAKAYDCRIGDIEFKLEPRLFNTGSCGWYFGGKYPFSIGDQDVTCTIGLNCTVVGSKTWSEGRKEKEMRKRE